MAILTHAHKNRLLSALPKADLDKFFSDLHSVALSQRDVLHEVGSPIAHVYFMEGGVASVLTTMADGASIEVGMVGLEGMVGLPFLLGSELSAQHVVVQLPGSALRMAASSCKAAFEQSAEVRRLFLQFFNSVLAFSIQTAACNRLHSAEQRLARWLLMSSDRVQSSELPLTQDYLSAMLGIRRTGVTEIAGALQRSALIHYRNGHITITDREGLAQIACECYSLDNARFERLFQ